MNLSGAPVKFSVPWGASAGGSFITTPIPVPSQIGVSAGRASFTTGFVPLNFTAVAAGGVPPWGADLNGILNMLSAALRWQQAGGPIIFDATFAADASGYPKGAVIMKASLGGFWQSTADGNTNNPDTGGANWIDLASTLGPIANVTAATSGSGGSSTTSVYQPTGATVSITKQKASNIVAFIGEVNIYNDVSSSPNGALANVRLTQDSASMGTYVQIGSAPLIGGGANGSHKNGATGVLFALDGGTLPVGPYNCRAEVQSNDGSLVNWNFSAVYAFELWTPYP